MAENWYGQQGAYDPPRPEADADAQRLGQYPGMALRALAEPFMRAYLLSQQASDAGGFSQLPPDQVGKETALMGMSMMGGGLAAGGAPAGAIAQNATTSLSEIARDLIMRGALPGAAAGGAYAAIDGSDVQQGMMAGAGLGAVGRGAWNVADDLHSGVRWPGSARGAPQGSPAGPQALGGQPGAGFQPPAAQLPGPTEYSRYTQLPPQTRRKVQDAYSISRLESGADIPAGPAADQIKQSLSRGGVNVPVTSGRVKNTNEAVNKFVADNGRPPTSREDWNSVFSSRTLAAPAAVGMGAAAGGGDDSELMRILQQYGMTP